MPSTLRQCIISSPGYTYLSLDAEQIELKVAAFLSQDPLMLEAVKSTDMHFVTAIQVFGFTRDEDAQEWERVKGTDQEKAFIKRIRLDPVMDKRRYDAKQLNFCLPETTQVLTSSGWKTHDKIKQGDWILGYDQLSGKSIWTPVLFTYHGKAPLVTFGNKYTQLQSTLAHRWYGEQRVSTRINGNPVHKVYPKVLHTRELNSDFRIRLSAPASLDTIDIGNRINITPKEAAIVGWLFSDGDGRNMIFQSVTANPNNVLAIDQLLIDTPGHIINSQRQDGIITWYINDWYIKPILAKITDWTSFILSLSDESRRAFIKSVSLAEGWTQRGVIHIAQNKGNFSSAIKLASYLEGYFIHTANPVSYNGKINQKHTLSNPFMTCQRIQYFDETPSMNVWCLRTVLGNFVAKDKEDNIFLTGNAILYGADSFKISEMADCSLVEAEQLIEAYFAKYPVLKTWIESVKARCRRDGYVTTLFGRMRPLPDINSDIRKLKARAEREVVNTKIQGTAVDIVKMMMLYLRRMFVPEVRLVLQVHDEILWEVPNELLQSCITIAKHELVQAFPDYPCSFKVGVCYGELKGV